MNNLDCVARPHHGKPEQALFRMLSWALEACLPCRASPAQRLLLVPSERAFSATTDTASLCPACIKTTRHFCQLWSICWAPNTGGATRQRVGSGSAPPQAVLVRSRTALWLLLGVRAQAPDRSRGFSCRLSSLAVQQKSLEVGSAAFQLALNAALLHSASRFV